MKNISCGTFAVIAIVLAVIGAAVQQYPWLIAVVVVIVGLTWWQIKRSGANRQSNYLKQLSVKGSRVEAIAAGGFTGEAPFELGKDEHFVYQAGGIQLAEFRSGGSTYQGGNVGFSVPVFGGVRAHVGGSQGQLVKNPEELTILDTGVLTFTSQRVVFAGQKQTREWTFAKILNIDVGPNGDSITLSASNKQTTSQLIQPDTSAVGPGILIGIAKEFHEKGQQAAIDQAHAYARQIQEAVTTSAK
mgnify:CR=1 FL=1